jgi:hypothetical protein
MIYKALSHVTLLRMRELSSVFTLAVDITFRIALSNAISESRAFARFDFECEKTFQNEYVSVFMFCVRTRILQSSLTSPSKIKLYIIDFPGPSFFYFTFKYALS